MRKCLAISAIVAAAYAAPVSAAAYNFTSAAVNGKTFVGSFELGGNVGNRTLAAFTGSFDGRTYGLNDVGIMNFDDQVLIGGTLNGANAVFSNTNDFFTGYFVPNVTAQGYGFISTTTGTYTSAVFNIALATAAVPEPATWTLMIMGMGAVGFAMRRRYKAARHDARFA
jgi:hypothetical protein